MAALRTDDILRRPLITEKNTRLMDQNQYTFEVHPEATKIQIKEAVESIFNVKVIAVNTLNLKPKPRIRGVRGGRSRIVGAGPAVKKAYVTLAEGQTIDPFQL